MDRRQELPERFFDVKMPRWFQRASFVFRSVCVSAIATVLVLHYTRGFPDLLMAVGMIIGFAVLLAAPSVPKAFIEQRNRLRGLRDGSLRELMELEKDSQGVSRGAHGK